MTPPGLGFFIWNVLACEAGNYDQIARLAEATGLRHVLIKVTNGIARHNVVNGVDHVPPLVAALRSRKISPWGWSYVYGYQPALEADLAANRVQQLGLDGYVINAEAEYKQPGKAAAASTFMNRLRGHLRDVPIGLSSYRYPSLHSQFPWRAFRELCDFDMPQVYWLLASNAGAQLRKSHAEFQAMSPRLPYFPTGAAFKEFGWQPTASQVTEFLEATKALGLPGANFWEWANTRSYVMDAWHTIAAFGWQPAAEELEAEMEERLKQIEADIAGLKQALFYDPDKKESNYITSLHHRLVAVEWVKNIRSQLEKLATLNLVALATVDFVRLEVAGLHKALDPRINGIEAWITNGRNWLLAQLKSLK